MNFLAKHLIRVRLPIVWLLVSGLGSSASAGMQRFEGVPESALELAEAFMERIIIGRGGVSATMYFLPNAEISKLHPAKQKEVLEAKLGFRYDSQALMNMLPKEGVDTIVLVNAVKIRSNDQSDSYFLRLVYGYGTEGKMFEMKTPTIIKIDQRVIFGKTFDHAFASRFHALISFDE